MKAETFINVSLNVKNLGESSIDLFIEGVDAHSNLKYFKVNLRGVYIENNNGKLNSIKIENELRNRFSDFIVSWKQILYPTQTKERTWK